ncbi:MAG: YeeE/YedE family protein [Myxococcales bacterium]|nr:YeeE/YedE family protein [Myxococcota bacterium]MDW8282983.1 YeeE/YedE family protein [Myxococcales bacterium]
MISPHVAPASALAGGVLLGLSASLLLLLNGRIAGISGIFGGLLLPGTTDRPWRAWFVAGLLLAGLAFVWLRPEAFATVGDIPLTTAALAGLLVGFGTRTGSGCTSGHGICGLARLSRRSVAATLTFMSTGAATVFVMRHLLGGSHP